VLFFYFLKRKNFFTTENKFPFFVSSSHTTQKMKISSSSTLYIFYAKNTFQLFFSVFLCTLLNAKYKEKYKKFCIQDQFKILWKCFLFSLQKRLKKKNDKIDVQRDFSSNSVVSIRAEICISSLNLVFVFSLQFDKLCHILETF
jgi:hypothetical protein